MLEPSAPTFNNTSNFKKHQSFANFNEVPISNEDRPTVTRQASELGLNNVRRSMSPIVMVDRQ